MKKLATLLLALILSLPLAVRGQSIQTPKGFEGDLYNATFALYGHQGTEERFLCTTTSYEKTADGYNLVGAGHCVSDSGADSYSVAEQIDGPETPVTVVKWEMDGAADMAIFHLVTSKVYPVVSLGTIDGEQIGDEVINVNFAIGIAKQLSYGHISSAVFPNGEDVGTYLVQAYGAPGSSGSAVVSAKTHKIIGIWIYGYSDSDGSPVNIGGGIEPIDKFQAFLKSPPPPSISDQEFKENFGPDHTFMLKVQGPDPKFEFGGHTFKVDTGVGLGLSDDYYYNVPVYIDKRHGGYWLVSTKDAPNYGVEVKLIS